MKVLMTCDAVGGVWQYATDLSRALAGQGVEVVLAVLGPVAGHPHSAALARPAPLPVGEGRGPAAERQGRGEGDPVILHTDLPLDWLAAGPDEVLRAGRAVAALAAEHRVDLVHLNSPALAAAQPFACPVVAVAHGCVGTWFAAQGEEVGADLGWHVELMRAGLRAADAVVAPTAGFARAVQARYDLPALPLVVHNGREAAAVADVAEPADHVLTAGRLWDRAKNTALLDAVAALLPVPVHAAGPTTGPHGETVAATHLHLLGTLSAEALAAEYAARPIFVSAARFEPFGLAVLEAAQAGCPLVLADTFRELWSGAALLVPEGTPAAYAAAIERVRGDARLRAHLSEQAQLRAGRYTVEAMAAGTLAVYRNAIATPQARAA